MIAPRGLTTASASRMTTIAKMPIGPNPRSCAAKRSPGGAVLMAAAFHFPFLLGFGAGAAARGDSAPALLACAIMFHAHRAGLGVSPEKSCLSFSNG